MQFDNNMLKRISSMDNNELREIIASVAREKGLNLPKISDSDIAKIRATLAGMSPAEIESLRKSLEGKGKH